MSGRLRLALTLAGVAACGVGVAVFLQAPADDPRSFPAAEDLLILGGLALTILANAGRAPRGRQRLRE